MHIVTQPIRVRSRRKVYLPQERVQVNGVGLGEDLSGFNIGKMFKNMFHVTPRSFQPKNIFGAIASGTIGVATLGMSSALAPKVFSAHSKTMKTVGMIGTIAAGAVTGGVFLAPLLPAIGGIASSAGGGLMSILSGAGSFLKPVMGIFGGMFGGGKGGGGEQQQYAPYEQPYAYPQPQQPQQYYNPMADYNMNVARSAGAPLGPIGGGTYSTMPDPSQSGGQSDIQLQSPDMYNLQDPNGQGQLNRPIAQAGMFPDLSMTTWLIVGGVTMVGWYLMSDSKKEIGNA